MQTLEWEGRRTSPRSEMGNPPSIDESKIWSVVWISRSVQPLTAHLSKQLTPAVRHWVTPPRPKYSGAPTLHFMLSFLSIHRKRRFKVNRTTTYRP
jgi:hypothetical protein